jgi:serpin B
VQNHRFHNKEANMKQKRVSLVLALILSFSTLAGCSPAAATPTPSAGQVAEGTVVAPPDPAAARDAVLAYLVQAYGDLAPDPDLPWAELEAPAGDLVGSSTFEYQAQDEAGLWIVAVSFPIVAPDQTIYRVLVANQDLPFQWQGDVDAGLNVTAAPPGVVRAREQALAYISAHHGLTVPAPGTDWTEFRATPEGLVGAETYEYRSEDWSITISYPVVAPENVVYDVVVANEGQGLRWEGQVTPQGEVEEVSMIEEGSPEGTPAADTTPGSEAVPASAGEVAELVAGNTAFALDLHQVLRQQDGNLFYSPYSLSLALAMTYAGARGETEAQMADAMHYTLSQARLHPAFAALSQALASRGEGAAGREGEGFRLNVANALWGQEGYDFLAEFLDVVDRAYGAGLRRVDYVGAPDEARQTINDWVANETEDRIRDLIPEGVIDALTRLVLTNAIYFNAAWAEPFEEDMTRDGPFHLLDGDQVSVPLMHGTSSFGYARGQGYQAVELPYDGHQLSMVILLPDAGEFEAFEATLDAPALETVLDGLAYESVALAMPRFEFSAKFRLEEALAALGMVDAFTGAADFSGMTGNRDLFLSAVVHQAFVSVDEAGTEAAAATAVVASLTAAPAEPLEVTVDRPFLFLIRDLETGAVLFLGRVLDPSAS